MGLLETGVVYPNMFFNEENDEQLVDIGARPFQTLRRIYISDHLDSKPEYHPLVIYKDAGKDEILAPYDGPGNWELVHWVQGHSCRK